MRIKDKTGEVSINNKGYKMTIIAYRNCNDIDVKFEDNTIVYGATYYSFSHGSLRKPLNLEQYRGKVYNSWKILSAASPDSVTAECLNCNYQYNNLRLYDIINNKSKMCNSCSRSQEMHKRWGSKFDIKIGKIVNGFKIVKRFDRKNWLVQCIDCNEQYTVENHILFDSDKMFKCKCKVGINYFGKFFDNAKDLHQYLVKLYGKNAIGYVAVCEYVSNNNLEEIKLRCENKVKFGHSAIINRLDECNIMHNGQLATIIDMEDTHNITVKFEDNTIVKGQYRNFSRGALENPNLRLRNSKSRRDVLVKGARVKSFDVLDFAYRLTDKRSVFYMCQCRICGLKDILSPKQMLEHRCLDER